MSQYPDDADGDTLRRVAAGGSDMDAPMEVDFMIAVRDQEAGERVAEAVLALGYEASVEAEEGDEGEGLQWTCYATRQMRLTHAAVVAAQAQLDALVEPLDAVVEGWGTAGNVETA